MRGKGDKAADGAAEGFGEEAGDAVAENLFGDDQAPDDGGTRPTDKPGTVGDGVADHDGLRLDQVEDSAQSGIRYPDGDGNWTSDYGTYYDEGGARFWDLGGDGDIDLVELPGAFGSGWDVNYDGDMDYVGGGTF